MTPDFSDLFRCFARIGVLSFGGPAAQISLMHEELVTKRAWLTEEQFLGALSFCMLLPGPEAMQLATYAGWRMKGLRGGLLAGLLFVVPGALVIFGLALGYAYFGQLPLVQSVFAGVQAAVVVIVLKALLNLSRRALTSRINWALALAAFVAMFSLSVPFPLVIAAAALVGFVTIPTDQTSGYAPGAPSGQFRKTVVTVVVWAVIWFAPICLVWLNDVRFLTDLTVFFSKLAVVTFGGAYAVLAYMTSAVVETHGWLTTTQMIDALGLAETTPGPLILVTEFTGILAGFQIGGPWLAVTAGILTLWVTFVPCFLWIFAGAPYVEALLTRPRLKGALNAISAAVVGVILNLSVWFALHVLFGKVSTGTFGAIPDLTSIRPMQIGFVLLSMLLMLVMRLSIISTLGCMALVATIPYILS